MASPPPSDSTILDRYELVERIAVGGMAEVFRAKAFGAHGFEKVLAIKRILPDLARDAEFEQRFIAEAKLAVQLAHANIVQVLDFGRFGGSLYIAMEYVDGLDLAALNRVMTDRGTTVPVNAALQIAVDMARGLDFAHQHGVVHRDVSPSNILLARSGEVKIADFGIAQAAEGGMAASGVRRIMGKWRYMSPEQARGEKLDARSDLFSLGAVLYELFTSKKLFPGDEIEDVVRNVRDMPIIPPSQVRGDLPPAIDAPLLKCLERDPAKRWSTAAEFHRALLEMVYSRTLVVAASDVADLVASVLPAKVRAPGPGTPSGKTRDGGALIDDIIRSELLGAAGDPLEQSMSRVTAQVTPPPMAMSAADARETETGSAFVRKGAGPDGITVWEVIAEPAMATEATVVSPATGAPPAAWPGEGEGAKPVGKAQARASTEPTGARKSAKKSRKGLVAALAVIAAVGAVVGVAMFRGGGGGGAAAGKADAGRAVVPATAALLEVVTEPPGAVIEVDGQPWAERLPAVVTLGASEGDRHRLALRLEGHRTFSDDSVVVRPGERLKYVRPLEPLRASLRVVTTPAGAQVTLDGTSLGDTPLLRSDLAADDRPHVLTISKKGWVAVEVEVALVDGKPVEIERTLEPEVRMGRLNLSIEPWAYVYFNGKRLADGSAQLSLPVGRQKLRLVNTALKKEKTVFVDVPAKGVGKAVVDMNN